MTLGAFGNLRPSETLNHLIRYLSTWSGTNCPCSSNISTGPYSASASAPPTSRRCAQSADQLHRSEARETCELK
ncbi:hypothetical protein BJY52DRAFT_136071 [Lactarius psammicola]|nr:hypothetical protein BJY52DRAFT_136071 [Lactarius psammicola]